MTKKAILSLLKDHEKLLLIPNKEKAQLEMT
jgi:hypothetical protein